MANILWLSDMDMKGSGYLNIAIPLCSGLVAKGHTVKAIGLGYTDTEHTLPFSIIPCRDFQEMGVMIHNLSRLWTPDIVVAAMDIPWHEMILNRMRDDKNSLPYIGIYPLESGPLCMDWAFVLMGMDAQFCISQFGADESNRMSVPAEHIQIGVDTASYRPPTPEERKELRDTLGYDKDTFVVLTVADNQERKNLGRAFEVVSAFRKMTKKKIAYNLVTREHFYGGWKLRSLAAREDIKIGDILSIYERGIEFRKLWALYATADAFLLLSRAEGLGMPVLEAMGCGLPVIGTGACGFVEHLRDGRGFLVTPEFTYPDVFGNGERYMVGIDEPAKTLKWLSENQFDPAPALAYVNARTWDLPINQLDNRIKKELEKRNGKA